jgi:hypothetical protein
MTPYLLSDSALDLDRSDLEAARLEPRLIGFVSPARKFTANLNSSHISAHTDSCATERVGIWLRIKKKNYFFSGKILCLTRDFFFCNESNVIARCDEGLLKFEAYLFVL